MPVTVEDLCALLIDLDAPDRLERPLRLDPDLVWAGAERLAGALGATAARLPTGHAHLGTITGGPIALVVGRYGRTVAPADHQDGSALLDEDTFARLREIVFANGFAISSTESGLTPSRPARPHPRLFSARTAEELTRQIRGLPVDQSPAAELRAWLLARFDLPADGPAEQSSLAALTPEQAQAEADRLRRCVRALATPPGSTERRWLAIDDTILDGYTILAIKACRDEFGGPLREAIEAFHERAALLRSEIHPIERN